MKLLHWVLCIKQLISAKALKLRSLVSKMPQFIQLRWEFWLLISVASAVMPLSSSCWFFKQYWMSKEETLYSCPLPCLFWNNNSWKGGKSTLDLCYASSEEIPELQRPRRATGNRRNLQCGDDFILRTNVTWDKGSPCLGAVGASVWGGRSCWLSVPLCW